LCLASSRAHRDLHSFPTRRSSDLGRIGREREQRPSSEMSSPRDILHSPLRASARGSTFGSTQIQCVADVLVSPASPDGLSVSSRSEEHTSELQSRENLVCRLLLEK